MLLLWFGLITFGVGIGTIITTPIYPNLSLMISISISIISMLPLALGAFIISHVLTKKEK
ncbi:hypothetical protein ACFLQL_00365 [Verrucomicrobiota bacterium]